MKHYSMTIAKAIQQYLANEDWKFTFDKEDGVFRFDVGLSGPIKNVQCAALVSWDHYMVFAMLPVRPDCKDPQQMHRVNEYLTRANYGMKNGCFEMYWRDGEIRFRVYNDCPEDAPSETVVMNSILTPFMQVERYAGGLVAVLFQGKTPAEAIACAEKKAKQRMDQLLDAAVKKVEALRGQEETAEEADLDEDEDLEEEADLKEYEDDEEDEDEYLEVHIGDKNLEDLLEELRQKLDGQEGQDPEDESSEAQDPE